MSWKTVTNLRKDRQRFIIILGIIFIVGLVLAPSVLPFIAPGEPRIPIEPTVDITIYHDPGTPYFDDVVTVFAYGRSVAASSYDSDTSFIITQSNSASGLYFVGDDRIEHRFAMVDTGDGLHFTGSIPAYPIGTQIAYSVSMTIDGLSATSGTVRYTVSAKPTENGDDNGEEEGPIPIQDQTPPEFTKRVILDDGTEISWSAFLGYVIWGTVHFEIEFTKGGNKIWSIGLEVDDGNGTYGKWYFSLKEGESYIYELDWDTTVIPDGEYVAEAVVIYWTGDTKPAGGHDDDIYVLPWATFALGGTSDGFNINYDAKLIVVVSLMAFAVVGAGMYKILPKRRKRK